jgi:cytochrome c556
MSKSKRDQYVEKMKAQLDDMNAQLDKLAEKSKSAKKEVQAKYKQEMADLRAQSSKVSAKLEELKAAGEDRWDSMIEEIEKIGDAFKHSYNYFKSQL